MRDVEQGNVLAVDEVLAMLRSPAVEPRMIIIDDLHLLAREHQLALCAASGDAVRHGRLVLVSGRNLASVVGTVDTVRLRRLPQGDTAALVRDVLTARGIKVKAEKLNAVVSEASGVPLFAVELARHRGSGLLAMPLLIVVCARMDGVQLDRKLLAAMSKADTPLSPELLALALKLPLADVLPSIDKATAAGVLARDVDGALSFSHPILRLVTEFLRME